MKRIFLCTICLICLIGIAFGQHDPERSKRATALEQEANVAYGKGDIETFKAKLKEALVLEPNRPVAKYNLACGYALTGDGERALGLLIDLAENGVDYGALKDPDFRNLHDLPAWQKLAETLAAMYPPVLTSSKAHELDQLDIFPEGIAYDRGTDAFYLGSMRHGTIIKVPTEGDISTFARVDSEFPTSILGITVDPKENRLWAVGTAFFFADGYADEHQSKTGVFAFDLKTGKQIEAKVFPDKHPAFGFNDLAITSNGDIYCSGGPLFRIPAGSSTPEQVLPTSVIRQSNGICLSPAEKWLFISSGGIVAYNLETEEWHRLEHADDIVIAGHDGMYFYENSIVGVQHGQAPWRVTRCYLSSDFKKVDSLRTLEQSNPEIASASTGALVGGDLYFVGRGPAPAKIPAEFDDDLRPFIGKTQIWRTPLDQRLP